MEYVLYHHGVKGMKWGVRRAVLRSQRKERADLRRAGATISEKRKQHYLDRSKLHRRDADDLQSGRATVAQIKQRKHNQITKGQKAARTALAGIGGLTVGVTASYLFAAKFVNDYLNIFDPKNYS